jgi:hypothetical protein
VLIGILAAILLAAGLVPPYWEFWKRRGRVIGISMLDACLALDETLTNAQIGFSSQLTGSVHFSAYSHLVRCSLFA